MAAALSPPRGLAAAAAANISIEGRRRRETPWRGGLDDPDPEQKGRNALMAKRNRERKKTLMAELTARVAQLETERTGWAVEQAGLLQQLTAARAEVAALRAALQGQSRPAGTAGTADKHTRHKRQNNSSATAARAADKA